MNTLYQNISSSEKKTILTCFAYPVHVAVHLFLQLLLLLEEEEAGPALHSVLLLRKLTEQVHQSVNHFSKFF